MHDSKKLGIPQLGYLFSLRSSYIPVRSGDKFFIEPHNPHRFGYYEALWYWDLILFCGSQSQVLTPCLSLNWRDLVTWVFRSWWFNVRVNDLRDKVGVLCASIEADPNKSRKSQEHASDTSAPRPKTNAGGKRSHEPLSKQGNSKSMTARDFRQGGSSSDGECDFNYKHKRRSKRRSDVDKEDITLNNADSFSDIQDFHIVPTNIPFVPIPRPIVGKGKGIRIATNKFRDNSPNLPRKEIQSPTQSLKSVDGPHSLELASKALEVRQSVAEDRTAAIQRIGAQYLAMLQASPYLEVPKRFEEASMVYRGIQNLKGDLAPLKCKVESYVFQSNPTLLWRKLQRNNKDLNK
uniref:Uncharacterized protein n=1 Tax=Chenopodium quinoa TaxID=63459 RepID=A0A803NCY6_CHEQI